MIEQHDDGAPLAPGSGVNGHELRAAGDLASGDLASGELGELWLLAALDPQRFEAELGAERALAFVADPRNRAEIAALRGFLGDVRTGLAHERQGAHARAARRVTRRVLARTTREERGWLGDLQLVGDFVADRLRASAWLRVAAAALFVQVTVVPILAWHMLREARSGSFQLRIERPTEPPEFAADGADRGADQALEIESPALDPTLPVLPLSEVGQELVALGARICAEVGRVRVPQQSLREVLAAGPGEATPAANATEWALAKRALALANGGAADVGSGADGEQAALGESVVARLLQLEEALDRRALVGHAAELSGLLDALGTALASAPAGSLSAAVQRRAVALQVVAHPLTPDGVERTQAALVPGAAYGEALAAALTAEGAALAGPWARAWLAALAEPR